MLREVIRAGALLSSCFDDSADDQSKRLFNVDHLPGTRLHEATTSALSPFPTDLAAHDTGVLEITFVAGDDLDGRELPAFLSITTDFGSLLSEQPAVVLHSVLGLDVDHVEEPREAVEGGEVSDVVDEKKGVGLKI